jgi:hypothetical protein
MANLYSDTQRQISKIAETSLVIGENDNKGACYFFLQIGNCEDCKMIGHIPPSKSENIISELKKNWKVVVTKTSTGHKNVRVYYGN